MDPVGIFEQFAFPIALSIVLLIFIGFVLRMLWAYFTNKEKDLLARLDAEQKRADENQEMFLTALSDQSKLTAAIADMLLPIRTNTDQIPVLKSAIDANIQHMNTVIEMIRSRRKR